MTLRQRTTADGAIGVRLDQRERLLIAAPLGSAAAVAAAFFVPWQLTALIGWDVAALFIVASVWMFIPVLDAGSTEQVSTREDNSHALSDVIMVTACVVSLVGVVLGLAWTKDRGGAIAGVLTAVAVFTVFLSWFTVHTLFVLRYARLYYGETSGGIDFPSTDDPPDYMDFVYVAFTIGMTFQVSDTGIAQRAIRRTVIRHALLSYVFGSVIVGIVINVVGSLIR